FALSMASAVSITALNPDLVSPAISSATASAPWANASKNASGLMPETAGISGGGGAGSDIGAGSAAAFSTAGEGAGWATRRGSAVGIWDGRFDGDSFMASLVRFGAVCASHNETWLDIGRASTQFGAMHNDAERPDAAAERGGWR